MIQDISALVAHPSIYQKGFGGTCFSHFITDFSAIFWWTVIFNMSYREALDTWEKRNKVCLEAIPADPGIFLTLLSGKV